MAVESNLAGVVRVAYEALTGEFNRDTDVAARNYVSANAHMSDSAVKLELAQDKLRREIARGPAASRAQQRALLQVRAAEREVAAETRKTTGALDRQNRELDAGARKARAAGGAYRSMRSGIGFAVAGLIGGTGLVYALRQSINAGIEQDKILANLRNALAANGVSWDQYGATIEAATAKLKAQSAFDDEELYASLQLLVRGTHDVNRALELNALAADLARGRNMDLVKAAQLVVRVEAGQVGSLRRLGINVDKNAKSYEAIRYAQEKYAGAAEAYANTAAGAQDRVTVAIGDTEKAIGRALLPTFEHYANALSDWLMDADNMKRVQQDANRAIETGEKVVRGLVGALRAVKTVAGPVVDALGGVENTVKALALVWVGFKVKALAGFAGTSLASRTTAARMVADAAVAGRAWDVATRPRSLVVTTTATGTPGAPTPSGRGGRKIPFVPGFNLPTAVAAAVIVAAGASGARTRAYDPKRYPRVAALLRKVEAGRPLTTYERSALSGFGGRAISELSAAELARLEANLAPATVGPEGGDRASDRPNAGRALPTRSNGGRTRGRTRGSGDRRTGGEGLSRFQRLTLSASRADLTSSLEDDLKAARELEAYYAEIASNEKLKGDKLFQARQDLYAAQQRTQGIEDQIASERQQAQEKAAAKRRSADEKLRRAREKAAKTEAARYAALQRLHEDRQDFSKQSTERGVTPATRAKGAAAAKDQDTVTRDELGSMLRDFLTGFGDMIDNYYGNVAGGSISTATLEHLTREQTSVIRTAFGTPRVGFQRQLDEAVMLG